MMMDEDEQIQFVQKVMDVLLREDDGIPLAMTILKSLVDINLTVSHMTLREMMDVRRQLAKHLHDYLMSDADALIDIARDEWDGPDLHDLFNRGQTDG